MTYVDFSLAILAHAQCNDSNGLTNFISLVLEYHICSFLSGAEDEVLEEKEQGKPVQLPGEKRIVKIWFYSVMLHNYVPLNTSGLYVDCVPLRIFYLNFFSAARGFNEEIAKRSQKGNLISLKKLLSTLLKKLKLKEMYV